MPTPLPRGAHPTGRAPDVPHPGSAPLVGGSIPSAEAAPSGGPPSDVLHDLYLDPILGEGPGRTRGHSPGHGPRVHDAFPMPRRHHGLAHSPRLGSSVPASPSLGFSSALIEGTATAISSAFVVSEICCVPETGASPPPHSGPGSLSIPTACHTLPHTTHDSPGSPHKALVDVLTCHTCRSVPSGLVLHQPALGPRVSGSTPIALDSIRYLGRSPCPCPCLRRLAPLTSFTPPFGRRGTSSLSVGSSDFARTDRPPPKFPCVAHLQLCENTLGRSFPGPRCPRGRAPSQSKLPR